MKGGKCIYIYKIKYFTKELLMAVITLSFK